MDNQWSTFIQCLYGEVFLTTINLPIYVVFPFIESIAFPLINLLIRK